MTDNTPALTPHEAMNNFRDRVKTKVRADIADMMPDDVIEALVREAIKEQFFAPRLEPQQYGKPKEHPSWFVETVTQAAKPILEKAVKEWAASHEEYLREFITQERLTLLAAGMIGSAVSEQLSYALNNALDLLRNR